MKALFDLFRFARISRSSIPLFGALSMIFGMAGQALAAPFYVEDALYGYGPQGSQLIRNESLTTTRNPPAFNFLDYNITHGTHGADLYAFDAFNAFGYKIKSTKDFCSAADWNLVLVNTVTQAVTPFYADGAPIGTSGTFLAPNVNVYLACRSAGHLSAYPLDTGNFYPTMVTAVRSISSDTQRRRSVLQIYCDADKPNPAYPNTTPPGYLNDVLDYRDHGHIVEFLATQCNDGLDNDSDGLTDAADPGCRTTPGNPATYDPSRDNEGSATTQCQDGIDNDSDGATDGNDFSCTNPQDNDETNPKAQCQDGLDNDNDGAIDFPNDFGCASKQDNDESNPKAQCEDGLDNDNDGAIDLNDFSCSGKQDNDETNPKAQCQDGIDNDNDGAIDFPNDFGCSSKQDNNESDATSQCQDGIDNDNDGATDLNDFSCSNSQDNDETNPKAQCQDGLDNDNDGATDFPNDFGCANKQDNDESNPKAQCQDGLDNDNDGAIDLNDFSCSGTQDNDETNPKSQCQDGLDNDNDGTIDYPSDAGCSSKQDNSENSDFLAVPTNLQASDNNTSGILVTWTGELGRDHKIYRSEDPNDTNPALFVEIGLIPHGDPGPGPLPTTVPVQYFDTSAVPGRIYNYAAKAVNGGFLSAFSNVDAGLRPSDVPGGDCDGDGVSDAQEVIDGTMVCDGGSFQLHLKSPAFSKYNTYLSQLNYLELVGDGSLAVQNMRVTVYNIIGQPITSTTLTVASQTQIDLDINAMVNQKDTYGVTKIVFDDTIVGSTLKGRMTSYRADPGAATYSFAFTKELRNPTRGDTYAGANSFDPQGVGFLVPNWMETINLDNVNRTFLYSLYNQEGVLKLQTTFTLAPLAERDIQAGHEFGQGVYLGVIQPLDGETKYFAGVSRYSSNSTGGSEAQTYNYAFNLEARAGTGASQYATISNEVGSCFTQTNWFEVTNTRSVPVTAILAFRDQNGSTVGSTSVVLNAKSQFHFNASALLPKGSYGSVKLDSNMSGALIAQSLVYYHDCSINRVQTAYAAQGRIAGQDVQTGSINSFLNMTNDLRLINTSTSVSTASVTVRPFGANQPLTPAQFTLGANGTLSVITNGLNAAFVFPTNSYGTLKVQTGQPKKVVPYVLRQRLNPDSSGKMDFVIPVTVQ